MNLNGKPFNPGRLRTPVVFERRVVSQDAGGFPQPSYATIAPARVEWKNVHGQEVWAAEAQGAEQAATLLARYRADVDQTCAVSKNGVRFEIVSIDDIEERHELMEIKVKRMGSG